MALASLPPAFLVYGCEGEQSRAATTLHALAWLFDTA